MRDRGARKGRPTSSDRQYWESHGVASKRKASCPVPLIRLGRSKPWTGVASVTRSV